MSGWHLDEAEAALGPEAALEEGREGRVGDAGWQAGSKHLAGLEDAEVPGRGQ